MSEHKLTLKKRELTGKKLKTLRQAGLIPSVVYGGKTPILTSSEYVATEKALSLAGYHSPINLDIAGQKQLAIVKDIQTDPVTRNIINIEFQAISANEVVEATTPIVILNFAESDASKLYHYSLTQTIEEIGIKAKPSDLPKELTIDASNLANLDAKITISDLTLPRGVELSDKELDPEQVIASLYDPTAEAAAREAESTAEAGSVDASDVPSDNGQKPESEAPKSEN